MNAPNGSHGERRVALVTGAARRVGAAIARELHGAGLNVAIHYHRSGAEARALAAALDAERPGGTVLVAGDIADVAVTTTMVAQVLERFGRLDVLVNNASTFFPSPLGTIDEAVWNNLVGANLKGPLFLCQAAAPALRERRGAVVNIVDIHALQPLADHPVYCAAKAGLVSLTRSLARALAPEVRVNAVAPGAILWPEGGTDAAARAEVLARTPLGRRGDPADIAGAVRYLALEAPYVTGQILPVDGGQSA